MLLRWKMALRSVKGMVKTTGDKSGFSLEQNKDNAGELQPSNA